MEINVVKYDKKRWVVEMSDDDFTYHLVPTESKEEAIINKEAIESLLTCVGKESLDESSNCNKPHVSGSFDDSDIKWVVYYGHTKDKRIFLDEETSGLDYYLEDSFRRNQTMKIFGEIFWNRIRKLVENYR